MARREQLTNGRELTAGRLHELLDYDPETGVFTWLEHRGRVKAGDVAGTRGHDGVGIRVDRRRYRASHLAVLWMTGEWPPDQINYFDDDDTNIRWANLRLIGRSQKMYNRGKQRNNSAGFKGVTFHKGRDKFQAQIQAAGDYRFLGYFDSPQAAHRAYCRAARRMHGKYARTT
jgi:AP2 domain